MDVHHVRGRWAWRILGRSALVDALGAFCREVEEEKVRQLRDDLEAEARERPVPSRIRERAEAMLEMQLNRTHRGGK